MIIEIIIAILIVIALGYSTVNNTKTNKDIKDILRKNNDKILNENTKIYNTITDSMGVISKATELNSKSMDVIIKNVRNMTPAYTVTLHRDTKVPVVKMRFKSSNNKIVFAWFLLDTGAHENLIDKTFLESIQYENSNNQTIIVSSTNEKTTLDGVNVVALAGGCPLQYNIQFYVNDMSESVKLCHDDYNINFGGVIGVDFMQRNGWQIDNLKHKLRIYSM